MDAGDLLQEKKFYNALCVANHGDIFDLKKLRSRFSSWAEAWAHEGSRRGADPEREWSKLSELGIGLLFREDAGFPALLREAPDAPFAIYHKGELPKHEKFVSIVGTRRA